MRLRAASGGGSEDDSGLEGRRRRSGATVNWGDVGEGEGFEEEVVAGGRCLSENLTVASFQKRAIAKFAAAHFLKLATASPFFLFSFIFLYILFYFR